MKKFIEIVEDLDKFFNLKLRLSFREKNKLTYPTTNNLLRSLDKIKDTIHRTQKDASLEFGDPIFEEITPNDNWIENDQIVKHINTHSPEIEILLEVGKIVIPL